MAHHEPPLYMQVADHLRRQIHAGELRPNDTVMAERDLAKRWQISRGTAVRALEALVAEGLVTPGNTRAGRKVRDMRILPIRASLTEQLQRRTTAGVDAWVSDTEEEGRTPGQTIDVGVVQADSDIAQWLDIALDAPVAVRRRLRTLDGEPNNQADTYYPMDIAQELPEILNPADVTQGVLALMANRGFPTKHYVDALRWRPPTPEEARVLRIGQGVSVLIQSRTGYMDGRPIHLTRTVWPGNTVELRYELPA